MKRAKITSSNSDAWIVSPKDKGRKSIKNGKVFLKNKSEFEIELFNPLTAFFFKFLGGIPVDRNKNENIVDAVVDLFKTNKIIQFNKLINH